MARYIDANKLKEEIDEWLESVGSCTIGKDLSYYGELIGCIEDTSTADVQEVKCGKNISDLHSADEFICSECNFMCESFLEIIIDEHDMDRKYKECVFKYCPRCGAKMEGE